MVGTKSRMKSEEVILSTFRPGRIYTVNDVNNRIQSQHGFSFTVKALRRLLSSMVDARMIKVDDAQTGWARQCGTAYTLVIDDKG